METKIIGHRGGAAGYPENTLVSFKKAVELNADGVEFDVQLTKDGEVVVIHDEFIDRTLTGKGLVKEYTLSELKKMSAGEYFDSRFKNEKIPTLREVLKIVKGLEIINIELKNYLPYPGLEEKVLEIVDEFKIRDKVIFSSFNHYSMQKLNKIQPEIKTAALLMAKIINPTDYVFKRGFNGLHMNFMTVEKEIIDKAHFMGVYVLAYTVNYPSAAIELIDNKIDMLVTDDIEMLKEVRS